MWGGGRMGAWRHFQQTPSSLFRFTLQHSDVCVPTIFLVFVHALCSLFFTGVRWVRILPVAFILNARLPNKTQQVQIVTSSCFFRGLFLWDFSYLGAQEQLGAETSDRESLLLRFPNYISVPISFTHQFSALKPVPGAPVLGEGVPKRHQKTAKNKTGLQ